MLQDIDEASLESRPCGRHVIECFVLQQRAATNRADKVGERAQGGRLAGFVREQQNRGGIEGSFEHFWIQEPFWAYRQIPIAEHDKVGQPFASTHPMRGSC